MPIKQEEIDMEIQVGNMGQGEKRRKEKGLMNLIFMLSSLLQKSKCWKLKGRKKFQWVICSECREKMWERRSISASGSTALLGFCCPFFIFRASNGKLSSQVLNLWISLIDILLFTVGERAPTSRLGPLG